MTNPPTTEREAVEAAVVVGRQLGLRIDDPRVLASAFAVRVHLWPAPVVARVPTWTAVLRTPVQPWLAREIAVTRYLADAGAPVVGPTLDVDPGPHAHGGLSVSLWQYVETTGDAPPSPPDFGRMLAELHDALRGYAGELPVLAPPANDIARALERLEHARHLQPNELATLRAAEQRLDAAIRQPAGPLQPLHGDAHPGNLIRTRAGLLWNDFEDVCRGPVAWDMASLLLGDEVLNSYPGRPDDATLETYRDVRRLHVVTWMAALPVEFEGRADIIRALLAHFAR